MDKVIIIGGSPMTGKSTVAKIIASKLEWPCISTDDIGEVLQTVTDINPMQDQNYMDYYSTTDKEKLIEDMKAYHAQLKPAIKRLIDIHSSWSTPIIIEGWAIYPDMLGGLEKEVVKSVWLIANEKLLEKRLKENKSFYIDASNPKKMLENYLYRSCWHNDYLLEQCKMRSQRFIKLDGNESPSELADAICRW